MTRFRGRGKNGDLPVDLGGIVLRGPWKIYAEPREHQTHLLLVDPADVRSATREESAKQARVLARLFESEGYGAELGAGSAWIEVLWTLAIRLESWDRCCRHLRAGLASTGGRRWRGWHDLLARQPRYALRRSFLEATRWGHGVPDGSRFEQGLAWHPASEAMRRPWEAWVAGGSPEPLP